MPCDTITTQSVKLANAIPQIIDTTLEAQGWKITSPITTMERIVARKGNATLIWRQGQGIEIKSSNSQEQLTRINKEYSKQAVTWAASRAGWDITSTKQDQLIVTRR